MLIILLMVQLGMRAGEVANAQTGDVDLANRLLRVQGKGGHERMEPIPDELFLALVVWLRHAPAGPLIGRKVGSSWLPLSRKYISKLTSQIMYRAGVKGSPGDMISAHALRRTAISDVLERGAPLNIVQAFAGHNQIASLSPYIRLRPPHELHDAANGRRYLEPG